MRSNLLTALLLAAIALLALAATCALYRNYPPDTGPLEEVTK